MGGIYLIQDDDELVEMTEQTYDSEDVLQALLAKYPNLLAGDQMDSKTPRRWLLVGREMGVPSSDLDAGRWSIDHLFLDQDGIPTLVEVKRSSDTRLRREVVGQLLEYAANAVAYWPIERIIAEYEAQCERSHTDSEERLSAFLGDDRAAEMFWEAVATNLRARRLRLVFVADVIPPELRRIVEFLSEQMSPADVFAVEVKQYLGGGLKTLVPRLVGSAEKRQLSGARMKKKWTEETFFEDLSDAGHGEVAGVVQKLLGGLSSIEGVSIWWGEGATTASFVASVAGEGRDIGLFRVISQGARVEIYFGQLRNYGIFIDAEARFELRRRYNTIRGVQITEDAISRYPSFPIAVLVEPTALQQFLDIQMWAAAQLQSP